MASKPGDQKNPQNRSNPQVKTGNTNREVKTDQRGLQTPDKSEISRPAKPAVRTPPAPGHLVGTVAPSTASISNPTRCDEIS